MGPFEGSGDAGREALHRQGSPLLGNVAHHKSGSVSITPPAALAAATADWTADVTIVGLRPGDKLTLEPPADLEATLTYSGCRVTARDTARLRFTNHSALAVTGATRTWGYSLVRSRDAER